MNYFSDEQLKKITSEQLWAMFEKNETDWLLRPEVAATRLKTIANITTPLRNPREVKNAFKELPFDETEEEDPVVEPVVPTTTVPTTVPTTTVPTTTVPTTAQPPQVPPTGGRKTRRRKNNKSKSKSKSKR